MEAKLTEKVWTRLVAGKSLDGLGLTSIDGRWDLRRLSAPEPSVAREYATARAKVHELTNLVVLRGVNLKKMDFSAAKLDSLRLFDCEIDDCRFEGARCRDWRIWGTSVRNTTLRSADLRGSALGGVDNGKRNVFCRVDFKEASLRQTTYLSADMVDCAFANVAKVDFQGTVFVNCTFEGELNDVLFYKYGFRGEGHPPNEMKGVDFQKARLRHVGFRGLDMTDVRWPADEKHVVVPNYTTTLDRVLKVLETRDDETSKKLATLLAHKRRWAGPNQKEGVVNKADLADVGGEEMVREFLRLVQPN